MMKMALSNVDGNDLIHWNLKCQVLLFVGKTYDLYQIGYVDFLKLGALVAGSKYKNIPMLFEQRLL